MHNTPQGKIRNGRFSIFDAESEYIPTQTKKILKDNLDNLKNSLNSLGYLDIKNTGDYFTGEGPDRFYANTSTGEPGMVLMRIMDTVQPFAVLKWSIVFFHDFRFRPWYQTILKWYKVVEIIDTLAVLRRK